MSGLNPSPLCGVPQVGGGRAGGRRMADSLWVMECGRPARPMASVRASVRSLLSHCVWKSNDACAGMGLGPKNNDACAGTGLGPKSWRHHPRLSTGRFCSPRMGSLCSWRM